MLKIYQEKNSILMPDAVNKRISSAKVYQNKNIFSEKSSHT